MDIKSFYNCSMLFSVLSTYYGVYSLLFTIIFISELVYISLNQPQTAIITLTMHYLIEYNYLQRESIFFYLTYYFQPHNIQTP